MLTKLLCPGPLDSNQLGGCADDVDDDDDMLPVFLFFYHLVFSLCVISHSKERSYNDEHNRRKDHFCLNAKMFAIVTFMCLCLHCDAPVPLYGCVCVCVS